MLDRETATERLRAAKADAGVSFEELSEVVGRDKVSTAALLLGAVSGTEAEAEAMCDSLGVSDGDVVERRLNSLQDLILAVDCEQGRPTGFDSRASVTE